MSTIINVICILGLLCSPVVAHIGNPPAQIAQYGFTQATMTYPGYNFGPIFLAHAGTEEGWAVYDIKLGDTVEVGSRYYTVTSIHRFRTYGNGWMVDLDTGRWLTNLQAYKLTQSYPNISFETCIPNPNGAWASELDSDWQQWGRLIVTASPMAIGAE